MTTTRKIISSLAAIVLIFMAGCEWSTPSSEDTWTMNGYDWFDFSGTFRGVNGGPIVTGFTYEDPTTEGIVNGEIISSASGNIAGQVTLAPAYNTGKWVMSGKLNDNVIAGTVDIDLAGVGSVSDNGSGGFVKTSGTFNIDVGSIDYANGVVMLTVDSDFPGGTVFPAGGIASASYQYGGTSAFGGNFQHGQVTPGSVTIFAGDYVFVDDGLGLLSTSDGKTGTIAYATGAWSINLGGIAISGNVTASYAYTINQPFEPGNTGTPVVTLTIAQVGNKLTIYDSLGRRFNGTIGVANGSGGTVKPTSEDDYSSQVMAQFTAYNDDIEIVGTLTGLYSSDEPGVLFNRTIQAVWIEPTVQGDVYGTAGNLYVPEFVDAITTP